MGNQTIVELLNKNTYTISDLKDIVYSMLDEESTNRNPLTIEDVKCTLAFTKPEYIVVKNPEKYHYFVMEWGDNG